MALSIKIPSNSNRTLLLLAHGSKTTETVEEIKALCEAVSKAMNKNLIQSASEDLDKGMVKSGVFTTVEYAFLTLQSPTLEQSLESFAASGPCRIAVLPLFLFSGVHVQKDIPLAIAAAQKRFPQLELELFPHIGKHPDFIGLIAQNFS